MSVDANPVVLHFKGHAVTCRPNESVLEAFMRSGVDIDFSCKSGMCHRCLLRCVEGRIPPQASSKLPEHQRAVGCILACQCRPTESMILAPKSPEDMVTKAIVSTLSAAADGRWRMEVAPLRVFAYRTGYLVKVMDEHMNHETMATLVSDPDDGADLILEFDRDSGLLDWFDADDVIGVELCLRGPLPVEPEQPLTPLPADPALWDELGGDAVVRAVLTSFYDKVYADAALAPFFERVTKDRIIGKQFAFLKESIQGLPVFLGEQPRNVHNWMVINDALFDHRQSLMLQSMLEHGLADDLIARWTDYEEQFRPDIVKYKPWPKRFGDMVIDTEQYETCTLDEATVCDYCGSEIAKGVTVRYHKRIGKIGCELCTATTEVR